MSEKVSGSRSKGAKGDHKKDRDRHAHHLKGSNFGDIVKHEEEVEIGATGGSIV